MKSKSTQIKIGLFGSSGKMGQAVEQMLPQINLKNKSAQLIPYLAVGKEKSSIFSISVNNLKNIENEILNDVDVWIDFSSSKGLLELLTSTEKFQTAIVSGSTGLQKKEFLTLQKKSRQRALFWASNLSPGLWAFRQAMKSLSSISDFDFAIEEIHHTQKKDQPSGTAKTLHQDLELILNKRIEAPLSLRLGGVFGVHTVLGASGNEVLTFQHQALNRTVFAEGALRAGLWLRNKKNGLYTMDDLFLKK